MAAVVVTGAAFFRRVAFWKVWHAKASHVAFSSVTFSAGRARFVFGFPQKSEGPLKHVAFQWAPRLAGQMEDPPVFGAPKNGFLLRSDL